MAKFKNKYTGTIVEPSSDVTAQTFAKSPVWEEIKEKPPKKAVKKNAGAKQK